MSKHEAGPPTVAEGAIDPLANVPYRWAAAVCALTFLTYLGTLRFQFVHDDRGQIVGNPAVQSWHAVPGYFSAHVWAAVGPTFLANDYRPFFLLWLRINDAVFGPHVAGWHFTTVLAHVAASYLVILLAQRIFRDWPTALFSGLIFGLHPVHIEAVAWISGVPEPLLATFLISAYLCWLRSRETAGRSAVWLVASLAFYMLALLTKETAVVLLLILFASQWMNFPCAIELPRRHGMPAWLPALKALLPFVLLTVVYVIIRIVALRGFSHPVARISWLTVSLTWPSLLVFYLRLLFWPVRLSPFYGLQFVFRPTIWNTVLPLLTLLLVAVALRKWAARSRPVALAIPWLVFPVLPVLDVQVFGDGNFAHNRYLYLSSVGFAMLMAAALRRLKFGRPLLGGVPSSQVWASVFLLLLFGFAVQVEDRCYANDAAFYSYAYARMGNHDPIIGMDYANTLAEQGDYDHAAKIYQGLIEAHPTMWNAYFNLGYMYYQEGQLAGAVRYLQPAASADPPRAAARFYLGLADFKMNRIDEAEANLRSAIALEPTAPNYHFALGVVLKVRGNLPAALTEFDRELELNPAHQAAAKQAAEIHQRVAGRH